MSGMQAGFGGREAGINRVQQGRDRGVAARGQVMGLDPAEDGLSGVQFRAVGRQIEELDALLPEFGLGGVDDPAVVDGGVVQHHHQPAGRVGHGGEHREQVLARQGARDPVPPQLGRRSIRDQDTQGVDPPPGGVLVRQEFAAASQRPTERDRLAGREAALVQVGQRQLARERPFLSAARSALAWATRAGSCWWRSVRPVRRQRARMPRR